uniref:C2H2-type domain-containing protein n=1 Tax=Psilocybe cubensis TaxID=181762 RepID=A0A8H8CJV3_PSICU
MSIYQPLQSQAGPSKTFSDGSYEIVVCKWGWCRSTFSNGAELAHHVIHQHARCAIPVRRRDLSLIRRAEEGIGESLRFSNILSGHTCNNADEQSQKLAKDSRHGLSQASPKVPHSTLPSPPVTSRANTSPLHFNEPLPGSIEHASHEHSLDMDDIISIPTADIRPLDQDENTHSFAALSSPTESSASFTAPDIPHSPSFSSLVDRSFKRKSDNDFYHKPVAKKGRLYRHHPLSQSANSSTGSHASVEQHLTQSFESSEDGHESGEDLDNDDTSSQNFSHHSKSSEPEDPTHHSKLDHSITRPDAFQDPQFTQSSSTEDSHFVGAHYELLTQGPSQFQTQPPTASFPLHFHRPKTASSSQMEHLSPPVPLSSLKYATSTPQQRQNWYQPPTLQCGVNQSIDQSGAVENCNLDASNSNNAVACSQRSQGQNSSKSKKFRSGTLQISPAQLSQNRINEEIPAREQALVHNDTLLHDIYGDILNQHDSQSYMDSSQSVDDFSYPPLQTQAPYESQSMSQY